MAPKSSNRIKPKIKPRCALLLAIKFYADYWQDIKTEKPSSLMKIYNAIV